MLTTSYCHKNSKFHACFKDWIHLNWIEQRKSRVGLRIIGNVVAPLVCCFVFKVISLCGVRQSLFFQRNYQTFSSEREEERVHMFPPLFTRNHCIFLHKQTFRSISVVESKKLRRDVCLCRANVLSHLVLGKWPFDFLSLYSMSVVSLWYIYSLSCLISSSLQIWSVAPLGFHLIDQQSNPTTTTQSLGLTGQSPWLNSQGTRVDWFVSIYSIIFSLSVTLELVYSSNRDDRFHWLTWWLGSIHLPVCSSVVVVDDGCRFTKFNSPRLLYRYESRCQLRDKLDIYHLRLEFLLPIPRNEMYIK